MTTSSDVIARLRESYQIHLVTLARGEAELLLARIDALTALETAALTRRSAARFARKTMEAIPSTGFNYEKMEPTADEKTIFKAADDADDAFDDALAAPEKT